MMHDDTLHEHGRPPRLRLAPWRTLLVHLRPYRRELAGLALSGVAMASADSFMPLVTAWIIDDAVGTGGGLGLGWDVALYLALGLAIALLVWGFIHLAGRAATGIGYDIRRRAFAHLQELSFSFYDRKAVGWLMARLTSDCARVSSIVPWFLLDVIWGTSFVVGIAAAMLWLHVPLALLVLSVVPALLVASVYFQRKLLDSQRSVRRTNSLLTATFNESVTAVRTTKTLAREEEALEEFRRLSTTMHAHCRENLLQAAAYLPVVLSIGSVGVGLALWRSGILVLGGDLSLGVMVAFMQYAGLISIPIREMAERLTQFQAAQASAERLQELLETEPEISDSPEVLAAWSSEGDPLGGERIREVRFESVDFAYGDGPPVLHGLSLRVGEGESVALVGETGSGKSTIVNLLGRFYEPSAGRVRLNGLDTREIPLPCLHRRLGVVLQTPHLFSGTIRENIRYGRLAANDAAVEAAAARVRADSFIRRLPRGWDTEVGEEGRNLSIGQRQLVSLARAVLADPEIFILDEATSSVDAATERLIQSGIEEVMEGRISFVVAHRLATVRRCDRILVIHDGEIIEQGNHAELLELGGRFARLHREQGVTEGTRRLMER